MATTDFFKIKKGLNLGSQASDPSGAQEGDFYYNSADDTVRAYVDGAWRSAVLDTDAQTLTNKTIVVASNTITTAASGNLAATELNSALAELQTDIDTRATDAALTAHIGDTSDAHDASAISFSPAGTVAATDLQAAVEEVATDAASALSTHAADTSTHGVGEVVGTSEAQTLSNKTFSNLVEVAPGAGEGIDVSSAGDLEIGASVGANEITIGGSSSTVVIPGNLQIDGTTVSVNTTNLEVEDKNIVLNNGGNTASAAGAGLTVEGDAGASIATLQYDAALASKFKLGAAGSEQEVITASTTQTLSNKTLSAVQAAIEIAEVSTPTTPSSGYGKIYFKSDGKLYQLNDDGTESQVGSGSGGTNYLSANPDAESSTTGWATYDDGVALNPVDGTGDAGGLTLTLTRSSTTPLRGTNSFLITPKNGTAGNGVSYDFTIDSADKAKVLSISFDYSVGATTSEGDYRIWIYDKDVGALIQPAPYTLPASVTGTNYKFQASFQTSSSSTNYRVIIHQKNPTATTLRFDNVFVGPEARIYGAPVTDWTSFTPTGSWSSNTTYAGKWRRVGDEMEIDAYITVSGAPTSANLSINLPSGYSIDTSKLAAGTSAFQRLGSEVHILDSGSAQYTGGVTYNSTTAVSVLYSYTRTDDAGSATDPLKTEAFVTQAAPMTFASGDSVSVKFRVPISGWSSSVEVSSSTDTRVVAMSYDLSSTQAMTGSYVTVTTLGTKRVDTHGMFNSATGIATIPVSGVYRISHLAAFALDTTSGRQYNSRLSLTGSLGSITRDFDIYTTQSTAGSYPTLKGSHVLSLQAGDTVALQVNGPNTVQLNNVGATTNFTIERLAGPSQIAANETVAAKYSASSTANVPDSATIFNFSTKEFDTHNSVTTGASWAFTAPVSGIYRVSALISFTSAGSASRYDLSLRKNGATQDTVYLTPPTSTINSNVLSTSIRLLAGDYISFVHHETVNGGTYNGVNQYVAIERIGNY